MNCILKTSYSHRNLFWSWCSMPDFFYFSIHLTFNDTSSRQIPQSRTWFFPESTWHGEAWFMAQGTLRRHQVLIKIGVLYTTILQRYKWLRKSVRYGFTRIICIWEKGGSQLSLQRAAKWQSTKQFILRDFYFEGYCFSTQLEHIGSFVQLFAIYTPGNFTSPHLCSGVKHFFVA